MINFSFVSTRFYVRQLQQKLISKEKIASTEIEQKEKNPFLTNILENQEKISHTFT